MHNKKQNRDRLKRYNSFFFIIILLLAVQINLKFETLPSTTQTINGINSIENNGGAENMNTQKIVPCLWFNDNAEEAVNFYTSLFRNSKIGRVARYDEASAKVSGRTAGSVLTMEFELEDYKFLALNGGPHFQINPSISFFLNYDPSRDKYAEENLNSTWSKLVDGGTVLMPLQKYPFSEKYGWVQDKFGVSWQLILSNPEGDERPFIIPSFLFVGDVNGKAEEATDFYMSLFDRSERGQMEKYSADIQPDMEGLTMYTDFKIHNQWFVAMDGGTMHNFTFNEGVSLIINCSDQDEIDKYWNKLTSVPEAEQCGWLKDKYGVSWQILPENLPELLSDPDPDVSQKATNAMLQMKKIIIEELEKAHTGN
ncbi:MAG: VOC family protein [Melioribacteraceae bacterium]|nr:VOC family protein [Melioribacteraceae bacterium]